MTAQQADGSPQPLDPPIGWPQPVPAGRALGWAGDLRPATPVERVIPPRR